MRIEIHLENKEMGLPIEIASCLIRTYLDNVNDLEYALLKRKELAEIAEHIQVYLRHSEV